MQKLEWMTKLQVGDQVTHLHFGHNSRGALAIVSSPVTITGVSSKSIFVGVRRFSKWDGREIGKKGRPIHILGNAYQCIKPIEDSDKIIFNSEREELIREIMSTDFQSHSLQNLRELCVQIRRNAR